MTRDVRTAEVFAAVVSEDVDPSDPEQRTTLIKELSAVANAYVMRQWVGKRERPVTIRDMISEWAITSEPDEVQAFQPAHDCAACRAGNDQAMAYLRDNPGRWVALANVHYTEVWRT